uniref:Uncharacterized protein n=1 Tax=Anopheles funestus TaxID=62324 RepID=A0A182S265_ANOFN
MHFCVCSYYVQFVDGVSQERITTLKKQQKKFR